MAASQDFLWPVLPAAYDFKTISDYDTEQSIEPAQAEAAIRKAGELIAAVEAVLRTP